MMGRMQERRDHPRLHGECLNRVAGHRIDDTLLDGPSRQCKSRRERTQLLAGNLLRAYTRTEEQGLGQCHRDGLVYLHPWWKQRLRLSSTQRGSMPEQTGMQRTALPRTVQ